MRSLPVGEVKEWPIYTYAVMITWIIMSGKAVLLPSQIVCD